MLDPQTALRLGKAASDAGFSLSAGGPDAAGWLRRGAADRRVALWLSADAHYLIFAIDDAALLAALDTHGIPAAGVALPVGAIGARAHHRHDFAALTATLRRLDQLAAAFPPTPLRAFQRALDEEPPKTDPITGATETEAVRRLRLGQQTYRAALMDLWNGRCAISGLAVPQLLRASHAKPWAACESDAERLDAFNGLLLAAHLDAAFDEGLIAVQGDGRVLLHPSLDAHSRSVLGLNQESRVEGLQAGHQPYLQWHRQSVFGQGSGIVTDQ